MGLGFVRREGRATNSQAPAPARILQRRHQRRQEPSPPNQVQRHQPQAAYGLRSSPTEQPNIPTVESSSATAIPTTPHHAPGTTCSSGNGGDLRLRWQRLQQRQRQINRAGSGMEATAAPGSPESTEVQAALAARAACSSGNGGSTAGQVATPNHSSGAGGSGGYGGDGGNTRLLSLWGQGGAGGAGGDGNQALPAPTVRPQATRASPDYPAARAVTAAMEATAVGIRQGWRRWTRRGAAALAVT